MTFFAGLGDYMDYVMSIPKLALVVKNQLDIRDVGYEKIRQIENQAIKELNVAKDKLLKIIKEKKIDPGTLNQDLSFIPAAPSGSKINILESLKMFETGEISISGFYSDNLQRYLFDIAVNLLKLGYQKELEQFVVTPTEYGRYNDDVNGLNTNMRFGGNVRGNFIFTKTWPKRFEEERIVNAAREIEPWGAFEMLVKFWKARTEVTNKMYARVNRGY